MSPPGQPPPPAEPSALVQQLLAEKRELMVAQERMRLELVEMQGRVGKADPRLQRLEDENRRLRLELVEARQARDDLERGLADLVERLRRLQ